MRIVPYVLASILAFGAFAATAQPLPGMVVSLPPVSNNYVDAKIDGHPAKCLTINDDGLKACNILYNSADGRSRAYYELRLFQDDEIYGRFLTAENAGISLDNFSVSLLPGGTDAAGALLLRKRVGGAGDITFGVEGIALFVHDKDDDEAYHLTDSLIVSEFSQFYRRDKTLYLEEANWIGSDKLDRSHGSGTYLAANWYRWEKDHFVHDTSLPVAARRLTRRFEREINRGASGPHSTKHDKWFLHPDTHLFAFPQLKKYTYPDEATRFPGLFRGPQREPEKTICRLSDKELRAFTPCKVD